LVAGQVDGVLKVLYDNAAIGGYIKVTRPTMTSATLSLLRCARIYSVIPPENLADIWLYGYSD
jgi:hypothetical protein